MNDTVPKAAVKQILEKILEVYNSGDDLRKTDFFARELPNLIASEDFTYNPKVNKEGE